jgi:hypothetical protein
MNNSLESSNNLITIDNIFIAEWHPKYDEIESDEPSYKYLVVQVKKELAKNGTISKEVFTQILNWKSARVKGKIRWHEFGIYENAIKEAFIAAEEKKLDILCALYGIGAPVGSTILHFMHPNDFPIIDIRTAESLHHNGYLNSTKTDLSRFSSFRAVLLKIANECPSFSLREIDRALFAYHKIKFSPGNLNRSSGSKQSKVVSNKVALPKVRDKLTIWEKVSTVFKDSQIGNIFSKNQIKEMVHDAYPDTEISSVIPLDYCYNRINGDKRSFAFRVFKAIRDNQFEWLDENYPYNGKIWWKNTEVGKWEDGKPLLAHDPRKKFAR